MQTRSRYALLMGAERGNPPVAEQITMCFLLGVWCFT